MADKDGMERKVYLLPAELVDRMRAYQTTENIPSEVEAARRLLNIALQLRDSIEDILKTLQARQDSERNLKILAESIVAHALVETVQVKDNELTIKLSDGSVGQINRRGSMWIQSENGEYLNYDPSKDIARSLQNSVPPKTSGGPSWESNKGDVDDEIPF